MLGHILGIPYIIGVCTVLAYGIWPEWFHKNDK